MLSGSVAMSVYVLPRATRDFDFVVNLQKKDIAALIEHFKDGYYCEEDAVRNAVKRKSMFNIDYNSGYKAEFCYIER